VIVNFTFALSVFDLGLCLDLDLGPTALSSNTSMGGNTVLKVGGQFLASGARKKKFFDPYFLASGGGQNIA